MFPIKSISHYAQHNYIHLMYLLSFLRYPLTPETVRIHFSFVPRTKWL